jgi:hypothetical protein
MLIKGQPKPIHNLLSDPELRERFSVAGERVKQKRTTANICQTQQKAHYAKRDALTSKQFDDCLEVLKLKHQRTLSDDINVVGDSPYKVLNNWSTVVDKYSADIDRLRNTVPEYANSSDFDILREAFEEDIAAGTQNDSEFWRAVWSVYAAVVTQSVVSGWVEQWDAEQKAESSGFPFIGIPIRRA